MAPSPKPPAPRGYRAASVINMLPRVMRAEHRGGYRIRLTFTDGVKGIVDFRRWIGSGSVFAPLQDAAYFKTFFLDGESVEWPNGASIAPEALHAAVRQAARRSKPKRSAAPKHPGTKQAARHQRTPNGS